MNHSRTVFLGSALLFLGLSAGCRSVSEQKVPFPAQDVAVTRPDLTRIYFVREDTVGLHYKPIEVFDGDLEIGELTPGTFLCWERAPGRTLGRAFYKSIDPSKGHVEGVADLDCSAGKAFYFNVQVDREGGKPMVALLDPEQGKHLVASRTPATHH
jgi:hypothetical protein